MPRKEKTLSSILKALARALGVADDLDDLRPLDRIILLILSRDSDLQRARSAMRRLEEHYVDWNDLRVSGVYEVAGRLRTLGPPKKALDKAIRLRELLVTVYNRFNKMNLDFLALAEEDPELNRKRERFLGYLQEMLREIRAESRAKARKQAAAARSHAGKGSRKPAAKKRSESKRTAKGKTRKPASRTQKASPAASRKESK